MGHRLAIIHGEIKENKTVTFTAIYTNTPTHTQMHVCVYPCKIVIKLRSKNHKVALILHLNQSIYYIRRQVI